MGTFSDWSNVTIFANSSQNSYSCSMNLLKSVYLEVSSTVQKILTIIELRTNKGIVEFVSSSTAMATITKIHVLFNKINFKMLYHVIITWHHCLWLYGKHLRHWLAAADDLGDINKSQMRALQQHLMTSWNGLEVTNIYTQTGNVC